jgi:hypothetical protein
MIQFSFCSVVCRWGANAIPRENCFGISEFVLGFGGTNCLSGQDMPRSDSPPMQSVGRVASLHVHPARGGEKMVPLDTIILVATKGIKEDARYGSALTVL